MTIIYKIKTLKPYTKAYMCKKKKKLHKCSIEIPNHNYLFYTSSSSKEEIPLWIWDQFILSHYISTKHEGEHQFMDLKQASGYIGVYRQCGLLQQNLQSLGKVVALFTSFYALIEELRRKKVKVKMTKVVVVLSAHWLNLLLSGPKSHIPHLNFINCLKSFVGNKVYHSKDWSWGGTQIYWCTQARTKTRKKGSLLQNRKARNAILN